MFGNARLGIAMMLFSYAAAPLLRGQGFAVA